MIGVFISGCSDADRIISLQRVSTKINLQDKLAEPFGIAVKGDEIYFSDGNSGNIHRLSPATGLTVYAGGFDTPSGIAFDKNGGLLVADSGSNTVKRIDRSGVVTIVAGIAGSRGNADGEAATATFNAPIGVAVSDDGRIFVADTYNDRIRMIENGVVKTLAGSVKGFADGLAGSAMFDTPLGIAVWQDSKLLVADSGNRRLRVVELDGRVTTLAGDGSYGLRDGTLGAASFVQPTAVALDLSGSIFITDGNAIRAIGLRPFAVVETISGGSRGFRNSVPSAALFNRPSGIAIGSQGQLYITDSDNALVREIGGIKDDFQETTSGTEEPPRFTASEFRAIASGRWPYEPHDRPREIAGTLGEIRGNIVDASSEVWFHNGLDIPGAYGETVRFIRNEKVLHPAAVENFETSRELLRMPTIGYIHIRLGREASGTPFDDERFLFETVGTRIIDIRIPRGTKFAAGDAVGTLNAMNHVHLIAGRSGAEMNAIDALTLPGITDTIAPIIEDVKLYDENWDELETKSADGRIIINGKTRVVVRAFDRKDGNPERRRLAPYKLSFMIFRPGEETDRPGEWNISFERMPAHDAVKFTYAVGSRSGATGETIFNFIASNIVNGEGHREAFIDPSTLENGGYTLRAFAADFFGNIASKDIRIEVNK